MRPNLPSIPLCKGGNLNTSCAAGKFHCQNPHNPLSGRRCIIGAFGALSTPLAGVMAEKLFGYSGGASHGSAHSGGAHAPAAHDAVHEAALGKQNLTNARSLENGLLVVTIVPTVSPPLH